MTKIPQTHGPSNALPQLNPQLDRLAFSRAYAQHGRVHIANVLSQASAERVHSCLKEETPYGLCLNTGGAARGLRNLTPQQRQDYTQMAWKQVGLQEFQFLFDQHPLSLNGEPYVDPNHYWAKTMAFLNGPEFLDFARAVTGIAAIDFVDAQATLYRAGHFLTAHDDDVPGAKRLAAYVMSFTSAWRPEWGGLLEFINDNSQIEAGYMPDFNTLKIFQVPMTHYVSIIAPYAEVGRYSITGWLRAR
jgi:Rps23 Pro-64 3,4-dihydroxylase Tpa1-like proline 4-hydroxylase